MDTRKDFFLQLAYFIALTFLISSCGGGGGDSSPSGSTTPPPPTFSFTKQMGSVADDRGEGVAIDSGGNIYVTGYTGGGLDGNTSAGGNDIFLIKYDSAANKQWTRQLGTAGDDVALGVAADNSGNIYVTGYTAGGLDGNTYAGGAHDIFLVKYDSAGNKQWTRQLGTPYDEWGVGVAVDKNGYVYVTGLTGGDLDGNTSAGGSDIFLVKYDSAGNKQWTRQMGSANSDGASGVAVDTNGNIYMTGYTYGDLDGNTNAGSLTPDIFLIKYDSAGNKQWTRQLGNIRDDKGLGVAVDSTGNIYVTGLTGGGLAAGWIPYQWGEHIFLVKYDSAGNKQWTREEGTWNGSTQLVITDSPNGISIDTSGYIYLTGYTWGPLGGSTYMGGGPPDFFLVKYDSMGNMQWTRQLGSGYGDAGNGIAIDSSGNIYATGNTNGGLDGNTNAGGNDIFLVKYNSNGVKQ
jgi:hypothetical protein